MTAVLAMSAGSSASAAVNEAPPSTSACAVGVRDGLVPKFEGLRDGTTIDLSKRPTFTVRGEVDGNIRVLTRLALFGDGQYLGNPAWDRGRRDVDWRLRTTAPVGQHTLLICAYSASGHVSGAKVSIKTLAPASTATVVAPDVVSLTPADTAAITGLTATTVNFGRRPAIVVGSVLVAGVSATTPEGLLRRVTALRPRSGGVEATTVPAAITDVLWQSDVDLVDVPLSDPATVATNPQTSTPATDSGAAPRVAPTASRGYARAPLGGARASAPAAAAAAASSPTTWRYSGSISAGGDNATAKGTLGMELSLVAHVRLRIRATFGWGQAPAVQVTDFLVSETGTGTVNMAATLSQNGSFSQEKKNLVSRVLTAIPISAEPPLVLVPTIGLDFSVTGHTETTVTWSATGSVSLTAGAEYVNGSWVPVHSGSTDGKLVSPFDSNTPEGISHASDLTVTFLPHVDLKLDGIVGPALSFPLGIKAGVTYPCPGSLSASVFVKANVGINIGFLAENLASYSATVLTVSHDVFSGPAPLCLEIETTDLPGGKVGVPYSTALKAAAGYPPYRWELGIGTLPDGVRLDAATGTLSGTPTSAGRTSFTAKVVDAVGQSAVAALAIAVSPNDLTVTTTSLLGGVVGSPYTARLLAAGGTPAYRWAVTAGTLPAGLTLDPTSGTLSGTPSSPGTATFSLAVTDAAGADASANLSIVVADPPLSVATTSLPDGLVGAPYSATLAAVGGEPGYTWSVPPAGLPAGLGLATATGVISGTPTTSGSFQVPVTVTDSAGASATRPVTLYVARALPPPVIGPPPAAPQPLPAVPGQGAPGATVGDPHVLTFDGQPYDFQTVGEFVAVVSSVDDLQIQVRQQPFNGSRQISANQAVAMRVAGHRVGVYLTPTGVRTLLDGTQIAPATAASALPGGGSVRLDAGVRREIVTWPDGSYAAIDYSAGSHLSLYVSLDPARNAHVSGLLGNANGSRNDDLQTPAGQVQTPPFESSSPFTQGWRITQASSLFDYAPGETTSTFTDLGFPYGTFTVADLPAPNRDAARTVCQGVGLDGAALDACTLDVAVSGDPSIAADLAVAVVPPAPVNDLRLVTTALPPASAGTTYFARLDASGGQAPYTWAITSGALPLGLTLDPVTGLINGVPTAPGTVQLGVKVTDSRENSVVGTVTLAVTLPPQLTTNSLPDGTVGAPYRATLTASGGSPGYRWSLAVGALPPGLSLGLDGAISGVPTSATSSTITVQVTDQAQATVNGTFTLTVRAAGSGAVWAWGANDYGQLGDGTVAPLTSGRAIPATVPGLSNITKVTAGFRTAYALTADGKVWAWGRNLSGELGDGTTTNRSSPVQVSGLTQVVAIASGAFGNTVFALTSDGTVWSWGYNADGEVGDGTTVNRSTPVRVSGLTDVVAIAAAGSSGYAIRSDGTLWAWGDNSTGLLGDGTTTSSSVPVRVTGVSDVVAVTAGAGDVFAVAKDGAAWAWGYNGEGQLGDGTTTDRLAPIPVPGLTSVTAMAAGTEAYALRTDGTVWGWGPNVGGSLGDGTNVPRPSPVQLPALTGATALAATYNGGFAISKDRTLLGWGGNGLGRLGDGTFSTRTTPIQVKIPAPVTAVTAADVNTYGVVSG